MGVIGGHAWLERRRTAYQIRKMVPDERNRRDGQGSSGFIRPTKAMAGTKFSMLARARGESRDEEGSETIGEIFVETALNGGEIETENRGIGENEIGRKTVKGKEEL